MYTTDNFEAISAREMIQSSRDTNQILSKSKILVIGVGGCGGNIADAMYSGLSDQNKEDIGFLLCNTDEDAIMSKSIPMRIVIGPSVTKGKGAGGDPEVGEKAALDSKEEIRSVLEQFRPDMVFITAGMGGGTGTGATHVIASITSELDILTVGVLTMPYENEGGLKNEYARTGLKKAKEYLDGRLIINNEELFHCGPITKNQAYDKANSVLVEAASAIADIILTQFRENIDFRDVNTCIRGQGLINIGTAYSSRRAPDTARVLISRILNSPLVADKDIYGSKNIIAVVKCGSDGLLINDYQAIMNAIKDATGGGYDMLKFADSVDETMSAGAIRLTLIATGYSGTARKQEQKNKEEEKQDEKSKGRFSTFFDMTTDSKRIGRHRKEFDSKWYNGPAHARRNVDVSSYWDDESTQFIPLNED